MRENCDQLYKALDSTVKQHFSAAMRRKDIELFDFILGSGPMSHLLLYVILFCPPLFEVEGLIFQGVTSRVTGFSEREIGEIQRVLGKPDSNRENIQRSFNRLNIIDIFSEGYADLEDNEEEILMGCVAEAWRAWLHWQYPDRTFVVEILGTNFAFELTFYEAAAEIEPA